MHVLTELFENFGVDWPKFLAQTILFLVVYLILRRFAFAKVVDMLEERRRRIEEGQLNAEKMKKQLAEAEIRHEEILRKANQEAKNMIDEARHLSEASTEKEIQRAVKDAENIIAHAQEAMVIDRRRMVEEVKKEMVGLIVSTTAAVTGKILTPEDQQRLSAEAASALS